MAKAVTEMAIGGLAIGASFALPGLGVALTATMHGALISMGGSMALSGGMSGLAALTSRNTGIAVGVTSPVGPWNYVYGRQKVGGVKIFEDANSNAGGATTSNNKQLHRVYALACHPCNIRGGWQLRVDGKQVLMESVGTSGWKSYSPTQIQIDISSISRTNGVVTMKLTSAMSGQDGLPLIVANVSDNTLNGMWIVTQPDPDDATTYTYICGGDDATSSGGYAKTTYADYKDKIYVEILDGTHTASFTKLLEAGTSWSSTDLCLGRTVAYVQLGYDSGVFPSAIPNLSWVIYGKNDIYDPRTGTKGYSNNAALCIADYMSLPRIRGGYGLTIGTSIPTDNLIAAANICDEQVSLAAGGTEARYACDCYVQLNQTRGAILQSLLSSCAGRLSYQGGQYSIFPGAWVEPTLDLTEADLVGPIEWSPRLSIRDTCNAVKGSYTSPENGWQLGDFPAYMCDYEHGYGAVTDDGEGDAYYVEDGYERLFKEIHLPCTSSSATAQRLGKIEMMRTRYQGRGKLRCSMRAYQAVALDTITLTHSRYKWQKKVFEVLQSDFVEDSSQGGAPTLVVELQIAETGSNIYDWATTEQLTPEGYKYPQYVDGRIVLKPSTVTTYSGPGATIDGTVYPSTISTSADGLERNSLFVMWTLASDSFVTDGGNIEVQWQLANDSAWTAMPLLSGSATCCYINNVNDGSQYNVRVRAINTLGVSSDWVTSGPATVSDTSSIITVSAEDVSSGTLSTSVLPASVAALATASTSSVTAALGDAAVVGAGATVKVGGSAATGSITLTTGTGTLVAGALCKITFGSTLSAAPQGVCVPNGVSMSGLGWSTSTTGLTLTTTAALAPSTTYQIGYSLSS
jgi:hypothetical protein